MVKLLVGNIERIPVAVKNIDHLFRMASEIIESDKLYLFLLFDGTRIYNNEYLESLRNRHRINCLYRRTDPEIVDLF